MPRRTFNPKRRMTEVDDPDMLAWLAQNVKYGGNPQHKRDPGDFDLTPPSQPRPDIPTNQVVEITEPAQLP